MILVGNQRGGAKDLALHLMKDENERVQLHELRGFVADDLQGAFQESQAVSRGTRCQQHLYSLSLSPPKDAKPDDAVFIAAVNAAEKRLGLEGQPRAVVFHEKKGRDGETRRHAHAVWCRIDTDTMTAKQISHDRRKLNDLARDLYIQHDWQMPRGFISKEERNPRNYTLAEWQQAKRADKDPDALKRLFQDAWAISDNKAAFSHALEEKGYILVRGDRRGFVAVDHKGETYSLSRWVGRKPKDLKAKLQAHDNLPSVQQAHVKVAKIVTDRLKELEAEERAKAAREKERLDAERRQALQRTQAKKVTLRAAQEQRRVAEKAERAKTLHKGIRGLWQRMTGERKRIEEQNRQAAALTLKRDKTERGAIRKEESHTLSRTEKREAFVEARTKNMLDELRQDRKALTPSFKDEAEPDRAAKRAAFRKERQSERPKRSRTRNRDAPSLER